MDISPRMVKLAKIRNAENTLTRIVLGDIEETGLPDKHFDVAVVMEGLHHVPSPLAVLKEMKRISNDLILNEPNALNPIRRISELRFRNSGVTERSFYEWQLRGWLKELGYKSITVRNLYFVPSFTPRWLLKFAFLAEDLLERIPVANKLGGGFLIVAHG